MGGSIPSDSSSSNSANFSLTSVGSDETSIPKSSVILDIIQIEPFDHLLSSNGITHH